jgi:ABC-type phosphate transport system substrate-binding protein
VAILVVLAAVLGGAWGVAVADPTLNSGGSSFAAPIMDQWKADAKRQLGLGINYQSAGSTFGRGAYISHTLDFAVSDIVFLPTERPVVDSGDRSDYVYVPVTSGGLSFMFNVVDDSGQRITDLKLTRRAACGIFTGAITKWNDPELVKANPELASFDRDIVPVVRQDAAGESYVFSQYCIAVADDLWSAFIADRLQHQDPNLDQDFRAHNPTSLWPLQFGHATPGSGGDGVANAVADAIAGKDAITYTAAAYAIQRNFPVASVENGNPGVFTQPDESNVTVALGYATPNPDPKSVGTFILAYDGPDPRAYFPSTYSYVLAQASGFPTDKGSVLGRFLCYTVGKGQDRAVPLRYARLSVPLVDIAVNAIEKIPGAPPESDCRAGAPPAPPAPEVGGGGAGGGNPGAGGTPGGDNGGSTPGGDNGGGASPGADNAGTGGGATTGQNNSASGRTATTAPGAAATTTVAPEATDAAAAPDAATTVAGVTTTVASRRSASSTSTVVATTTTAPKVQSGPPSNGEVLWVMAQGGGLCAAGVLVAGVRRRAL